MSKKMKIEIWSDISCPFCYIGKHNMEAALEQFKDKDNIEVIWKSYLLDPSMPTDTAKLSVLDYISERKGMSKTQAQQIFERITEMGKDAGIQFQMEKSLAANTVNAHRIIQKVKTKNLGPEAEELFFKAHFEEGKDVNDEKVLYATGAAIGLTEEEIKEALTEEKYQEALYNDIEESQQIGVRGVPFFVLDRKYGISGAQPVEAFTQTIEKAFEEWRKENPVINLEMSEGASCSIDGTCN